MTPDPTLAARLARLRGGEHEAEADGDYDTGDLDQAAGNAYRSGQLITAAERDAAVQAALDSVTTLHTLISNIRTATVGYQPMLADLPAALVEWCDAAVKAAVQAERERLLQWCDQIMGDVETCIDLNAAEETAARIWTDNFAAAIRARTARGDETTPPEATLWP